jgi:hypothetical protein
MALLEAQLNFMFRQDAAGCGRGRQNFAGWIGRQTRPRGIRADNNRAGVTFFSAHTKNVFAQSRQPGSNLLAD